MINSPLRSTLVALLALTTLASALAAPAGSDLKEKPILWPDSARPQLRYSEEEMSFDGGIVHVGRIVGPAIDWETSFPQFWEPAQGASGDFSLLLKNKMGDSTVFGISLFDGKEFLPDLSASTWTRFIAGLNQEREGFSLVSESSSIEGGDSAPHVMGHPTRVILYTWTSARRSKVAELDVLFFYEKKLVVFRLIGSPSAVTAQYEDFCRLAVQIGEWRPAAR